MQAHHYPFIDLAVHHAVRDRFAHGDAVAVLDPDLEQVLWANGPAADLFGFETIYDVLEEGLGGQPVTLRQIRSAKSALERTGRPQSFMMRLASGFSRRMTPARLENITLPDGAEALMISSEAGAVLAPGARARQIISGFEGTGTHVAVLDAGGAVLAASRTFDTIGLDEADISRMIDDVAGEDDRLVKRMVRAGAGAMPAAIGRLTDDPLMHLLFAVEPMADDDTGPDDATNTIMAPPVNAAIADDTGATVAGDEAADPSAPAGDFARDGETRGGFDMRRVREELDAREPRPSDSDDLPRPFAEARGLEVAAGSDGDDGDHDAGPDSGPDAGATSGPDAPADQTGSTADAQPIPSDHQTAEHPVQSGAGQHPDTAPDLRTAAETPAPDTGPDDSAQTDISEFRFDPEAKPARFVWKIDSEGAFSEVSPEFAAAVGPHAADIVGRKFPDLAQVFNLDPDHVIADLLNRRDTWSGKTVYWPIQGTDLVTPVDLAALPTYTRDRRFDGFRGFGIVRSGETRKDPEALGLALVPGARRAAESALAGAPTAADAAAADGDDATADPAALDDEAALEAMDLEQDVDDLARIDGADRLQIEDDQTKADDADASQATGVGTEASDPFQGERPALQLVETPMRRESDKVIDLESRRSKPARESLSEGEQAAFREIGARLNQATDGDGETGADDDTGGLAPQSGTETDRESTSPAPQDQPPFGKRPVPPGGSDEPTRDIELAFDTPDQQTLQESSGSINDPAPSETTGPGAGGSDRDDDLSAGDAQPLTDAGAAGAPGIDGSQTSADKASSGDDHAGEDTPVGNGSEPDPDPATQDPIPVTGEAGASARDEGDAGPRADDVAQGADQSGVAAGEEASEAESNPALPSAFALPPRQVMTAGPDPDLIDAIPTALLVHGGEALLHANSDFLDLTGYESLDELANAGGLDTLLDRPGEQDEAADGALLVRRRDGTMRPVTARLRSINWGEGQALLLALTPDEGRSTVAPVLQGAGPAADQAENVAEKDASSTDAEAVAGALEVEARDLRSILETATDGVVVLDRDGAIRSMNGSACALFNYNEGDVLEQPFAMLFAHESQRAVMDYLAGLAEHGVSSVLNDGREVIGREASGGFLPLFMTIGRLSGSDGYCAVLRDITQWKRTEEELRTAKRAAETANSHKSDFLARVSHEIRTPLNAIIGFSEMMVEERFGPIGSPRYLEYAHDIGNSGKHVLDIVNDLLDISKIEAGQVDMEFVAVSLNDHLAESVSLLQPMANSQRVIIRTSLSASVPDVVADQRSVKQIALNLLSNAIRYTPSGGQIVVSTSYEASGNVIVRIRDTGIGMNRKELEQAMKPFGQVGPGPRQRGEGTGLGLPLTKAMVEANRAQFDIVSAPGEGTLVSISFPPQRVLAD